MTEQVCSMGFEDSGCMDPLLVRPMRLISAYLAGHDYHAPDMAKLRAEKAELKRALEMAAGWIGESTGTCPTDRDQRLDLFALEISISDPGFCEEHCGDDGRGPDDCAWRCWFEVFEARARQELAKEESDG